MDAVSDDEEIKQAFRVLNVDREDVVRRDYLTLRSEGWGHRTAAIQVGVTPSAMSAIINTEPRFAALVEEAEAITLERVENVAWARAQAGVKDFALPLLQTRKPEDWMPTKQVDVNHGVQEIDLDALRRQLEARKELEDGYEGDGEDPSAEA